MWWIVGRRRDRYGRLIRRPPGLPDWVETDEEGMRVVTRPTSFANMFRKIKETHGYTKKEVDSQWEEYCKLHPLLGKANPRGVPRFRPNRKSEIPVLPD